MTTRFLGRWARLLATRCPISSSSAATHLPPLFALEYARVHSSGQLLHSQVRGMCKGLSLIIPEDQVLKQTDFLQFVEKTGSPEDVLQLWEQQGSDANQAAMSITRLTKLSLKGGLDCTLHLQDPRLLDMLSKVSSRVSSVWNSNVISLLWALTHLGFPPEAAVMQLLVTEALWRLRRLTYRQLGLLVEWVSPRTGPRLQELQSATLKQLELRWTELADARTASSLIARMGHLSPSLMEKLEDKALELAEKSDAEDIRRVAVSLASQGRRSVPLLRALSYHLQQKPSKELTIPVLLDFAFACGKLNFKPTQVLQRIAEELLARKAQLSSRDVTRCAKSFALLKWLHLPLFECLTEHYLENSQKYSTLHLCNLILSLARLNFQPSKAEEFYGKVHEALQGNVENLEPYLQTDVVWSLCILQQAKPQYIKSVLGPVFKKKLAGGNPSRAENYRLKLIHIAATAQLENLCPSTTAAVLSPHDPTKTQETGLHTSLKDALECLTRSNGGTCRTGVHTIYGWTIDGELVVDSDNKPMDVLAIEAPHLCIGGRSSPMPPGARRIAFLVWEFSSYNSKSKDLLGRFAMQRRHLQLAGFLTVEVPYFEWQELKNDSQKVAYLKDKMGKAVAEEMAK